MIFQNLNMNLNRKEKGKGFFQILRPNGPKPCVAQLALTRSACLARAIALGTVGITRPKGNSASDEQPTTVQQ
jgi:hypothetical protein